MTHASDYLENALLNFTLRNTPLASPASLYVALFSAFTEAGTQTELAGSNYARQPITFDPAAAGSIASAAAVDFPTAADNWSTVTHVGLFDNSVGGNLLFWSPLGTPRNVAAGKTFAIEAGELSITLSGDLAVALRTALLDHLCRNIAYAPAASVYAGVLASFTDDETFTELAGDGYARSQLSVTSAASGSAANDSALLLPEATANWPAATHAAVFDAQVGGNLLYRGALDAPVTVEAGETLRFAPGQLTISHD